MTTAVNAAAASVPRPLRSPSPHVMPTCTSGIAAATTTAAGSGSSSTLWLTRTMSSSVAPTPAPAAPKTRYPRASCTAT